MRSFVFWPQLFGCWSPGTRSLCAEGALSGHVAPLSHTDHPMIVIFEKQREKRVKPIMRQWVATHSVRSQWTRPWWAPSAHPEAIKAACAKHPRPRRFISACWNVLIQNDPQRLKVVNPPRSYCKWEPTRWQFKFRFPLVLFVFL